MKRISTKIIIFCLFIALAACARSPKNIDTNTLNFSIAKDITDLTVNTSLQNIDLNTAIAIAIRLSLIHI